ncbi:MAG: CoA transferase [Deltaproteobacteria bacterium]|nr:CoA transferase [Deltaproteobacteria bacterium]
MKPALTGIRIIDFTRALAGPYCTMLLADMGAEVVKIEMPGAGDDSRSWGPPFVGSESAFFLSINRNKKSIALDLKQEAGRDIALRLIGSADIVVEGSRPGVMKRLGLDYERVRTQQPALIYCSISAFGQTGPYSEKAGYDQVLQGYGGIMGLTGEPDGRPMKVGLAITDLTTAMFAVIGIVTALYHRKLSGRGQYIDTAMLDGQVSWLTYQAQRYWASGQIPARSGSGQGLIVPHQPVETADGFINIAVGNENLWQSFTEVLGLVLLKDDPRFATNPARVENRRALLDILEPIFKAQPSSHWLELFDTAGIPCGPIYTVDQVVADPQVRARDMVSQVSHPAYGAINMLGFPIKFSETPGRSPSAPPTLGEHTEEVLESLGITDGDIKRLRNARVIN